MFENPRRGRQVSNFTTNVPKILDLKSSSEQIFFRKLSLGAPDKLPISGAAIADLLLADIWALGMIFFCMINPSLKYPFCSEIRSVGRINSQEDLKKFIGSLLREEKHPLQDTNYEIQRATVWCGLEEVYKGCVKFEPHCRLPLDEAAKIMKVSSDGVANFRFVNGRCHFRDT